MFLILFTFNRDLLLLLKLILLIVKLMRKLLRLEVTNLFNNK